MFDIETRVRFRTRTLENGCLIWLGYKTDQGYGKIRINGRNEYVHRVMYELLVGPIPDGYTIDHSCPNTSCWNPQHTEAVTSEENRWRQFARPNGIDF